MSPPTMAIPRGDEARADAEADCQRQGAEQCSESRHHNGAEANETSLVDGFLRFKMMGALNLEGKVNHHDGVLLDDSNKEDDADHCDNGELESAGLKS